MKKNIRNKSITVMTMVWTMAILSLSIGAQTRIGLPKNKYKVQDDVKLGRDAARQVEQQMPILNDSQAQAYVTAVGQRLVASIPSQFQQPAFNYTFKIVNASDINAFALPGGPMFVNRGMIEAAKNEGEMAGVMAHEISHVALRHATAQQTKINSPLNQIFGIGAILGGAVLGGETGAALGQTIVGIKFTSYSREYETQADILGAQIMAAAGYDPRDLANIFQTIAQQSSGGRAPEWLSTHPDPGNRFQKINQEASRLRVSSDPIKVTREFARVKERFSSLPRAQTTAEIEQAYKNGQGQSSGQRTNPTAGGRYTNSVALPSTRVRAYNSGGISLNVPVNWREFSGQDLTFAPEGGYGDQGITHGAMIGVYRSNGGNFGQSSEAYVNGILQNNSYLRQRGSYTQTTVAGRQGYTVQLLGRSPVTNQNELVTIYTAQLRSGDLIYIAAVVPESESYRYSTAFRNMINSIRLNE